MISECMNPECRKALHYLRDGRVIRSVKRDGEHDLVEHFWLCGDCNTKFDFSFEEEGRVSLKRRSDILVEDRSALILVA